MGSLQEIEVAIANLPREDFLQLRNRIQRRFDDQWDEQLEQDVVAGKLDALGQQALAEHRTGRSRPFPADAK
jgi:hypothetical protein